MSAGISSRLRERIHDVLRSGQVGVPYPEGDDVGATRLGLGDLPIDLGEEIGGQLLDALGVPQLLPPVNRSRSTSPMNEQWAGPVK